MSRLARRLRALDQWWAVGPPATARRAMRPGESSPVGRLFRSLRELDDKFLGPPKAFSFLVGEHERHEVTFAVVPQSFVAVLVDGEPAPVTRPRMPAGIHPFSIRWAIPGRYKFSVGDAEKHDVVIRAAVWRHWRVTVDGRELGHFRLEAVPDPN